MKYFAILMIALLTLNGCKKNPDDKPSTELPAATHTGANTFGCLIDGKPFVVTGKYMTNTFSTNGVSFSPYGGSKKYWLISARCEHPKSSIEFRICYQNETTYDLVDDYYNESVYYDYSSVDYGPSTEFKTDNVRTGKVTITHYTSLDSATKNHTISFAAGTFAFDAINSEGKVVHITEGRFDIAQ